MARLDVTTEDDVEHWGAFWSRGTVTTFGTEFVDNYDAEILDFWEAYFSCGLDIVDLACGNGALTWLADDYYKKHAIDARITGVDIATIDPFKALSRKPEQFPGVSFIGNNSVESLPFEAASVDLVISQFGVEYSNLANTIPEVARILKPGGTVAFICHHSDSAIVKSGVSKNQAFELLQKHQIVSHFLALDELYSQHRVFTQFNNSSEYTRIMAAINKAFLYLKNDSQSLDESAAKVVANITQDLLALFPQTGSVKNKKRRPAIEAIETMIAKSIERTNELLRAALTPEDQEDLLELLRLQGFTIQSCEAFSYQQMGFIGVSIVGKY